MVTCKNCRYWEQLKEKVGKCIGVDFSYECDIPNKVEFSLSIDVDDDSGLSAMLLTGEDFYCAKFFPKKLERG